MLRSKHSLSSCWLVAFLAVLPLLGLWLLALLCLVAVLNFYAVALWAVQSVGLPKALRNSGRKRYYSVSPIRT